MKYLVKATVTEWIKDYESLDNWDINRKWTEEKVLEMVDEFCAEIRFVADIYEKYGTDDDTLELDIKDIEVFKVIAEENGKIYVQKK